MEMSRDAGSIPAASTCKKACEQSQAFLLSWVTPLRASNTRQTGGPKIAEGVRYTIRSVSCMGCADPISSRKGCQMHGIDDRKRAEERLHNSERTLRTLMDASPESILLIDTDETILFANATMARRLGTTADKIVGHTSYDLVSPELAAKRMERLHEVVRTGKAIRFEDERAGRCFEIAMHPICDEQGSVTSVAVLAIDQTERKLAQAILKQAHDELERRVEERTAELVRANRQLKNEVETREHAEDALRQNHDELQAIYDGMFEGLVIHDFETKRILRVNASMCRMLGYTEDELLSMSVADLHPKDCVPKVMQVLHARVVEGFQGDVDIPVLRKDGSVLYVNIIGNPFIYRRRQCIAGFFRDITERKNAHEALLREHRTLKHLLHSSDHERQLIAYEIHDGLAQQLAGAIMQFQTFHFLKEMKPKEAAKAYDAGMTMLQQGHFEARRLISGVRPPILDEEGVVAAVAHLVNEQNRLKGPKVEYYSRVVFDRLSPTLENAIYRITQEGLTNACLHSESRKVRAGLSQREDRVRIDIRDWGIGFDSKAVQDNRFGLEGIRQRVRLLGGRCRIRSKAGKGTRIIVELPVVERDRA